VIALKFYSGEVVSSKDGNIKMNKSNFGEHWWNDCEKIKRKIYLAFYEDEPLSGEPRVRLLKLELRL
jgi:hypothetical protein